MAARVKIGLTGAFPGPGESLGPLEGARRADLRPFHKWYWQQPNFTDGCLEPLPPGRQFGPLHNLPYTIIGLNVNFGIAFSVERHARLGREPNFPTELKPKLFV